MIKKLLKKFSFIKELYEKHLEKKEKKQFLKKCKTFYKSLNVNGKSIFLLGAPTHSNIGDSAIAIVEKNFITQAGIEEKNIIEITLNEFNKHKEYLIKRINKSKRPVFLLGGGNMGNQWMCEEQPRRDIIQGLKKNRIVIFPQTIFYTDNEIGRLESEKSKPIYNGKKNLTIIAREKKSFDIINSLYPETKNLLTPDIVLSTEKNFYNINEQKRNGILFVIRNDAERAVSGGEWDKIIENVKNNSITYRITDMHHTTDILEKTRFDIVRNKLREFASSKLVITDRLHGMIFAAITGTPCIVFSNYNHKVKGTYEWINYLPYIKYVESIEQAIVLIPEMLKMKNCKFDNKPLLPYFDKLKEIVKINA